VCICGVLAVAADTATIENIATLINSITKVKILFEEFFIILPPL